MFAPGTLIQVAQLLADKDHTLLVGASIEIDQEGQPTGKLDLRHPSWKIWL